MPTAYLHDNVSRNSKHILKKSCHCFLDLSASSASANGGASGSHGPSGSQEGSVSHGSGGSQGEDADPKAEADNSFRQYRRLCADIADVNSYNEKTRILSIYLKKGNSGGKLSPLRY